MFFFLHVIFYACIHKMGNVERNGSILDNIKLALYICCQVLVVVMTVSHCSLSWSVYHLHVLHPQFILSGWHDFQPCHVAWFPKKPLLHKYTCNANQLRDFTKIFCKKQNFHAHFFSWYTQVKEMEKKSHDIKLYVLISLAVIKTWSWNSGVWDLFMTNSSISCKSLGIYLWQMHPFLVKAWGIILFGHNFIRWC